LWLSPVGYSAAMITGFFMNSHSAGFTLIELLIVVAIIGILAAVAIPQLNSYRNKAYNASAISDLVNLKRLVENYRLDMNRYPTL
jgi:type II secretion system protein G